MIKTQFVLFKKKKKCNFYNLLNKKLISFTQKI